MNLAKTNKVGMQCTLPFENISPWKSLIDPVKVCEDLSLRLKEIEDELTSYHQPRQLSLQRLQQESLSARERFEMTLSCAFKDIENPNCPPTYRIGRGGRMVAIRRNV